MCILSVGVPAVIQIKFFYHSNHCFFAVTILIVKQKDAHGRRKRVILFENTFVRKKEFIFENHNKDDKGEKQVLLTSG